LLLNLQIGLLKLKLLLFKLLLKVGGRSPPAFNFLFLLVLALMFVL